MTAQPTRHGEITGEAGPDGWAVYDPDTDKVHLLNESAKAIWELCDGNTTTSEMAAAISEITGLDLERAMADVEETIDRLGSLGLVTYTKPDG